MCQRPKKQRLKMIPFDFRLCNPKYRTAWPNFWFHKQLWGNCHCFALVFPEQEPNVPEDTKWHPPHQAGTGKDVGYLQRVCRLCCEWAVNYQGDSCCLPGDRVARCLWSSEIERCTLFPPQFLFYTVTVVAWKQKQRIASIVLGIIASQVPYGQKEQGWGFYQE